MKYLRHLFCSAFFCAVFSASGEEMPNILRNEALSFEVGGHVGERLSANEKTWLVPQTYLATRNPATLTVGRRMTELLAHSQRSDGYLGPWSDRERFDNPPEKWDTWGHYHCLYGLYQWYRVTGDRQALEVVCRAADCLYDYFILGKRTFASQNWGECNFAASHMFALLYEQTRDPRYLQAAEYIVRTEWTLP